MEKVVQTDKTVMSYRTELAKIHHSWATAFYKNNEKSKAVESLDKAILIIRQLKETDSLRETNKNLLAKIEAERNQYKN